MPTQDTSELKEKILSIIRIKGPSLPVHISQGTGISMLFASAFLSELLSEKKLKLSYMKVGNSPIYFIPGQEASLEKYSVHLKSKEKDAFHLLNEKSFLKDLDQEPAIRVALRSIRDFAIPFKRNEDIFWRYFSVSENTFQKENEVSVKISEKSVEEERESRDSKEVVNKIEEENLAKSVMKKELLKPKKKPVRKVVKKTVSSKANERFFEKVKEYLLSKNIEISGIIGFSKNDLTLKINEAGEEKLLVAYNKRSIREEEILKAYKRAKEANLRYLVLSLGDPLKKLNMFIDAINNLEKVDKIEE